MPERSNKENLMPITDPKVAYGGESKFSTKRPPTPLKKARPRSKNRKSTSSVMSEIKVLAKNLGRPIPAPKNQSRNNRLVVHVERSKTQLDVI